MEKFSGIDKELLANAVVHNNEKAAQEARDDIANSMSESFGMLAQAAVAKSETLDSNATTIAALTKSLVDMTATNKILTATNSTLVAALAKSGGLPAVKAPSGFSQTEAAPGTTSHAENSAGVVVPTKMGNFKKMVFL